MSPVTSYPSIWRKINKQTTRHVVVKKCSLSLMDLMYALMTWKCQGYSLVHKMWQISDCQSVWIPWGDFILGAGETKIPITTPLTADAIIALKLRFKTLGGNKTNHDLPYRLCKPKIWWGLNQTSLLFVTISEGWLVIQERYGRWLSR